ncbi:MAG TPA: YggT family protein [Verrucomicrobiae bacterium]|nr:YggT family protein [Verrucomicrobiae bacterium]
MANYVRQVQQHDQIHGGTRVHTMSVSERSPDHGVDKAQMVIYYIVSAITGLLLLRFVLSLLGANRTNAFADFIYSLTAPLVGPFQGLFGYDTTYGVSRFETETVVAIIVDALIGWGISALLNLARRDVHELDIDG